MWPVSNAAPNCVAIRTGGLWCNSVTSLQDTDSFCISTGHCCCVMVFSSRTSCVSHIRSTHAIHLLALRIFAVATRISTPNPHYCNSSSNKISHPGLVPFNCLFTCPPSTCCQPPSQIDSVCCLLSTLPNLSFLFAVFSKSTFFLPIHCLLIMLLALCCTMPCVLYDNYPFKGEMYLCYISSQSLPRSKHSPLRL